MGSGTGCLGYIDAGGSGGYRRRIATAPAGLQLRKPLSRQRGRDTAAEKENTTTDGVTSLPGRFCPCSCGLIFAAVARSRSVSVQDNRHPRHKPSVMAPIRPLIG